MGSDVVHEHCQRLMSTAISEGEKARIVSPPNPWVGAIVETQAGNFAGHTQAPGESHAEMDALIKAGRNAAGSTMYVTLEPCAHQGRTPPCAEKIVEAGIKRVVIGIVDPDQRVRGRGIEYLQKKGVEVIVGVCADQIKTQLAPYLKQRSTGIPWVVLKLAVTLDGRIAASDGSSNWITGEIARDRVQQIRLASQAVVVGANTIRVDDSSLRARIPDAQRQPIRVVLGSIPEGAKVQPAEEFHGPGSDLVRSLGQRGVLQVLIEGGSQVAKEFLDLDLVDQFVFHIAPAVHGGSDGISAFAGKGALSVEQLTRLSTKSVTQLGGDTEIILWSKRAEAFIESL